MTTLPPDHLAADRLAQDNALLWAKLAQLEAKIDAVLGQAQPLPQPLPPGGKGMRQGDARGVSAWHCDHSVTAAPSPSPDECS